MFVKGMSEKHNSTNHSDEKTIQMTTTPTTSPDPRYTDHTGQSV